jgi:hypothetical protein
VSKIPCAWLTSTAVPVLALLGQHHLLAEQTPCPSCGVTEQDGPEGPQQEVVSSWLRQGSYTAAWVAFCADPAFLSWLLKLGGLQLPSFSFPLDCAAQLGVVMDLVYFNKFPLHLGHSKVSQSSLLCAKFFLGTVWWLAGFHMLLKLLWFLSRKL